MEETQRQKKIAGIIQKDLADILQRAATDGGLKGTLISVSKVSVTVDLSLAKAYEKSLKGEENPIENRDLLDKHKKSWFWTFRFISQNVTYGPKAVKMR